MTGGLAARARRATVTAVAAAAAVGLAGCTADRTGAEAPSPAAEASSETSESSTAQVAEEVRPRLFLRRLEAGFDATTTAHLSLEATGQLQLFAEGDADFRGEVPEMMLTMGTEAESENLDWILVDDSVYTKVAGVTNGKYARYAADDPSNQFGAGLARLLDPRAAVGQFAPGLEAVTFVGDEDVAGTAAGHYRLSVDSTKLAAPIQEGMPQVVEIDVWLDDSDRIRQLSFDLNAIEFELVLTELGEPVTITAPPRRQVLKGTG